MKIVMFADADVGLEAVTYVLETNRDHLMCVIVCDEDRYVKTRLLNCGLIEEELVHTYSWAKSEKGLQYLKRLEADYFILSWWPKIIPSSLIHVPKKGVMNFHPGYLPYTAGKHTNFWSIVNDQQFGVTIHFVDEGIDSGDIAFQKKIEKTWEDTGETLYRKEKKAMIELFKESYPKLEEGNYTRTKQDTEKRIFHYAKDMFDKVKLNLDDEYTVKDLLNLLRAKTFQPHEGCTFIWGGISYEVKVSIRQVEKDTC